MALQFPVNPNVNDTYTYNEKTYVWNGSSWGTKTTVTIETRNPSWPDCKANAGDNKIVGLYAVWPGDGTGNGGNFFAVTISGNYNIDYGDGTVTNYNAATTAYYEFNYNNSALDGTDAPVTFTASTNTVNRTSHKYNDGMTVKFYNIVTTTGLTENKTYYVINSTANTFQVSLTENGTPVTLTNDGSATLLPYKIATVTITPQSGSDLTSVNFYVKHNQSNLASGYSTGWLELAIACPLLTGLTIGNNTAAANHLQLERVYLNQLGNITGFNKLFYNCRSLREVYIADTITTVTTTNSMFFNCFYLQSVSLFNTSSVINMGSMFYNCFSLSSVPLFDTSIVTDMTAMFRSCSSLVDVPAFDTSSASNMNNMFNLCDSLTVVPAFNTSLVTNMSYMFNGCYSLFDVPAFDTSSVTNMSFMFNGCNSLTVVPVFNTSLVTNMSNMFEYCYSLFDVPAFDTSSVTNMSSMFSSCSSLLKVPNFNTSSVTTAYQMFYNCNSLAEVPAFNFSVILSSGSVSNIVNTCTNLTRFRATGIPYTFSVASCKLSATALNEIYTNLPTVTGQTITVTGNYGIDSDNTSIATAKGWTVVG